MNDYMLVLFYSEIAALRAISIISVKAFCLSSAVVTVFLIIWSEIVKRQAAFFLHYLAVAKIPNLSISPQRSSYLEGLFTVSSL